MQGTVDEFSRGLGTPMAALLVACLGAVLGLRCVAHSARVRASWKPWCLVPGAAAIGSGVWSMHFIAMTGFTVTGAAISYDQPTVLATLLLGTVTTALGVFVVGYRGATPMSLVTGGTITGLSVVTTHYLGMAGLRTGGHVAYDTPTVVLSVVVAVAGATTALWTVVSYRGLPASLGAGMVMGGAATGAHYIGMTAVMVHLPGTARGATAGHHAPSPLVPVLAGPAVLLLVALVMIFAPCTAADGPGRGRTRAPAV